MPIYEFYCRDCHVVFNFFARSINTTKIPGCPRCPRPQLERRMSSFAISKGRSEPDASSAAHPDMDDAAMESLMEDLGREAERLDQNDPRGMASLMRRLYEKTGMPLDERAEEAIRRMEAGEDPDKVEEQMGDVFDDPGDAEEGQAIEPKTAKSSGWIRRLKPPEVDDTLYDL